jgi:hypothetical protein
MDRLNPISKEKMQAGFILGIVRPVLALNNTSDVNFDECPQNANLQHWQAKMK